MTIGKDDTILITGASGFFGHHIVPAIEERYPAKIITLSSKDFDLTKENQVVSMFEKCKPTIVIHLAAHVGGIMANKDHPADFFFRNLAINTMVLHYSHMFGIKKLLTPICGCSYPADADSPIEESMMWKGYPQFESAPYSLAKRMVLVQLEAYRRQHNFNSVVVIPGNLYGEHDNFHAQNCHVVPAMIRRFHEAKTNKIDRVSIWGTGRPKRDFVYACDVAALFPYFLENYDSAEPVNISTGEETSIKELASTVKEIVGYRGEIAWDSSKPDGQMVKIFGIRRLKSLGLSCPTPLRDGLKKTIDWFVKNYQSAAIRL